MWQLNVAAAYQIKNFRCSSLSPNILAKILEYGEGAGFHNSHINSQEHHNLNKERNLVLRWTRCWNNLTRIFKEMIIEMLQIGRATFLKSHKLIQTLNKE